jgi:DNA-binding winged helix-turn-helix (wHTH) protein
VRLRFGDLLLDESTRQLLRGGREVHLSPKAFDLLAFLLDARPRALSKMELHARLWPATFVSEANLAMLVAEIRGALGDQAKAPRFVRTVPRYGYAFHGDATEVRPARSHIASDEKYWLIAPLRQIPLTPGDNIVGRDPSVQVWLNAISVSRRHARITLDRDLVTLEDLKSKNGTRVRGRWVNGPCRLAHGDDIRFGSIEVTFHIWAASAATRTEPDRNRGTD